MPDISGIHHVTAICGDPQHNVDFYTGVLGMRLVKKSVNPGTRRGEQVIVFADRDGQHLALTATRDPRTFAPWAQSPVPAERQILGLHNVRLWERELASTKSFLTSALEFSYYGEEDG